MQIRASVVIELDDDVRTTRVRSAPQSLYVNGSHAVWTIKFKAQFSSVLQISFLKLHLILPITAWRTG